MRTRTYDLDSVLELARDGYSAPLIIEALGLTVGERTIQKAVSRYLGPPPPRPKAVANDRLRRRVVAWMVANGLDEHYCYQCQRWSAAPCSIRELRQDDDLGSLAFVCRHCRRAGDV